MWCIDLTIVRCRFSKISKNDRKDSTDESFKKRKFQIMKVSNDESFKNESSKKRKFQIMKVSTYVNFKMKLQSFL